MTEQIGAVRRITTNRPHVLNAQSRRMLLELDAAFAEAFADDSVRVIILAGSGKHFSSVHDLGSEEGLADCQASPRGDSYREEYAELQQIHSESCLRWRNLPKPTIAQVRGYCIMGGLMIASVCDLIVASDDGEFADRMVSWGGAHVQYFSMPWNLVPRKAKEYLFTTDFLGEADAERLSLVNRVIPRDSSAAETMDLAQRIAERDPFGLMMAKRSVNETINAQGFTRAVENSFKNYMLSLPHRKEVGTFGAAVATSSARDRIPALNALRTGR